MKTDHFPKPLRGGYKPKRKKYFQFFNMLQNNPQTDLTQLMQSIHQSDNLKKANDWTVAPNPSSTYIRLTNSGTSKGSEQLQIFGMYGNLVQDTPLASDTKEFIFSTEFWPAGIYFYRIIDGKSKNATGQFVVTH